MVVQRSPTSDRDPTAPTTLAGGIRVAGIGLLFWAAVQLAASLLERRAAALALVQAALAEWGAGRTGVTWSDPLAPAPTSGAIVRRAARGAALGCAAATAVVVLALGTHTASIVASTPSAELCAVGLFSSALAAVRDELLLRGVVLRAIRGMLPTWAALLACGVAATAARFGLDDAMTTSIAFGAALRGTALAALWVQDRGAWTAWAANASWTWTLGSLAHGGMLDVSFTTETDGAPSAVAVLAAAAVWLVVQPRLRARA